MPSTEDLCDDLADEQHSLKDVVAALSESEWDTDTPAPGWTIRHQIAHLAFFDGAAVRAASDPEGFEAERPTSPEESEIYHERGLQAGLSLSGSELLSLWERRYERFHRVFRSLDGRARVAWFGPSMSVASKITARIMETWAHGQDVLDALGLERVPTRRLRHIAHIGVKARPFAFQTHGLELPTEEVRVELRSPDGESWCWGALDAENTIRGSALDFCLVVTRRRHRGDTRLVVEGDAASRWIDIAQSYAGDPGPGRQEGQFPASG
jgi:uncharacterized protein (TIGR03084 family)